MVIAVGTVDINSPASGIYCVNLLTGGNCSRNLRVSQLCRKRKVWIFPVRECKRFIYFKAVYTSHF